MFAINLDYPSFKEEVEVVKATTSDHKAKVNPLFTAQEIIRYFNILFVEFQLQIMLLNMLLLWSVKQDQIVEAATELVKNYIDWGAGPRASQNLILSSKNTCVINGKFSPDIEDVQAVAA